MYIKYYTNFGVTAIPTNSVIIIIKNQMKIPTPFEILNAANFCVN